MRVSGGLLASLLITASLVTSHQPARADDPLGRSASQPSFDEFIQKTLQEYDVPGAVVAVSDPAGAVFLKGYGVRRRGAPETVDQDTRFQLASVSKFVAATAIGTLIDRGVVSWDAPVVTFWPKLALAEPYATANVTLRDFLAHRSGLPAYAGDALTQLDYGPDELVRRARFMSFSHSFRAEWAYSNYGIFLGQESAARAAGMSAPELLTTAIFQPLKMTRTGPTLSEVFNDGNRATPHNIDGSIMDFENVDTFSGAGAIVSTGADMARWVQMLLAGGTIDGRKVLDKKTITQIFASSMVQGIGGPLQDPNDSAGLGSESYHFLRGRVIEKNGALYGIRTIVTLIPERNIGIAVFANKQLTVFPEAVRAEFLERELGPSGRDLQAQIRHEQAAWNSLVDIPKPPANAQRLGRDLAALAGQYTSELYGPVSIARDGVNLRLQFGAKTYPVSLSHWSGDTFLLTSENPDIEPGLVTFAFGPDAAAGATGFDGATVPGAFSVNYGHFDRVR